MSQKKPSTRKQGKSILDQGPQRKYRAHLRVALYREDIVLAWSSPQVDVRGGFLVEVTGVHDRPERQNFLRRWSRLDTGWRSKKSFWGWIDFWIPVVFLLAPTENGGPSHFGLKSVQWVGSLRRHSLMWGLEYQKGPLKEDLELIQMMVGDKLVTAPVGHGERIAGTLRHFHPAGGHPGCLREPRLWNNRFFLKQKPVN